MKRQKLTNFIAVLSLTLLLVVTTFGQLSLTNTVPSQTVDFSSTIAGVNNGSYVGTGLTPAPAAGQLDSDAFAITGMSDGVVNFGGTGTTGDFARGNTAGGVTTGGLYNQTTNVAVWFQPAGSDFNPGTITLRIQNNGTSNITDFNIAYDILVLNDQTRANSFNFSYSTDGINFTPVGALDYTSPEAADALGVQTIPRSTMITPSQPTAPNGFFFIRWSSADVSGSGNRDEFGLDNIAVTATYNAPTAGEVFVGGRVTDVRGHPIANATVILSGGPLTQTRTVRTSGFGYFGFRNVSVGNSYLISVIAGRYSFNQPALVINLTDEENNLLFTGTQIFGAVPKNGKK